MNAHTAKTKEDLDDFETMEKQVLAAKDLPIEKRVAVMNRLMANFLIKRGELPDHLKTFADN